MDLTVWVVSATPIPARTTGPQRLRGTLTISGSRLAIHQEPRRARFVDSTDGALRLYRLPAYSPQLNPDEWVWKNVKHDGVAPAVPKGPEQMRSVVTGRLRRLQRLPHIVRGFFADPELAYITAIA